ncbi:MAG TPA: hypothetical protein VKE22_25705 [Haliangiales bacterium]|nr:hypothetical protein [Haliangiales bacterium]
MSRVSALAGLLACAACVGGSAASHADDTGLSALALTAVAPGSLVPGSRLMLVGDAFVDAPFGDTRLRLRGTFAGAAVDVTLAARFIDDRHLDVAWKGGRAAGLPGDDGAFQGDAIVEVTSAIDGEVHAAQPRRVRLDVFSRLVPAIASVDAAGVIYVNEPIAVTGEGFLLGGDEGDTVATVAGCFTDEGAATCRPVGPVEVVARAADRGHLVFPFHPSIAGIRPGEFQGTIALANRRGSGPAPASGSARVDFTIAPPAVFSVSPPQASLGQFVEIRGGGFVGGDPADPTAGLTLIELTGRFTPAGGVASPEVTITLVPEFESGPLVRYVLDEDDDLGQRVDLRATSGSFAGTVRPIVKYGADTVAGDAVTATLGIARLKQVVWLRFLPSYVDSLRHFGVRALDARIRERAFAVARRDYAGVNVEFRADEPTDFKLYSTVDIGGPDPNGLGLFGYDNTPGKDVGNLRLYDRIGGVNAITQVDGNPGYGGVFVESFFGFSLHPGRFAPRPGDGADAAFDAIFDPFRPDAGGAPVLAVDLAGVPTLASGDGCPSGDRRQAVACAVWVLGSMIGTTMTHEIGHSLGLAQPDAPDLYHNPGDQPNRLMDAGGARTLRERAELGGEGPSVFCDGDYAYLRRMLPAAGAPPAVARPTCN